MDEKKYPELPDSDAWVARLKAVRTRLQYKRLHHLFRLVAYLEWRIEQERVPIVKQALTHKRNLTRMEFGDYPAELREIVRGELEWMRLAEIATNELGQLQIHSANFAYGLFIAGKRVPDAVKANHEVVS